MKSITKIILSAILAVVFLFTCIFVTASLAFGLWLNTYSPVVGKTLVATFTVSELKEDEGGKYIDVTYQPYIQQSAFNYLFKPERGSLAGDKQDFKLYGDSVHIGGPVVQLHSGLVLFNFQTIYKITNIYGRYNLDVDAENTRIITSNFEVNNGIDGIWQLIADSEDSWPTNMFVNSAFLSTPAPIPSIKSQNEQKTYNLYVTATGFIPERIN